MYNLASLKVMSVRQSVTVCRCVWNGLVSQLLVSHCGLGSTVGTSVEVS